MALTAAQILQADDLETREVPVPEWGGTVLVKGLSGSERDRWEASVVKYSKSGDRIPNPINFRTKLVVMALVDDEGKRMFAESDVLKLAAKSSKVMERLYDVVAEMSGIAENAVEEMTANFGGTPDDDSTSPSPESSGTPSLNSSHESLPVS